jgi:XkdW protein.
MSLFAKIKKIYPDLTDNDFSPEGTILLQNDNDGKGDYIKEWKHPSLSKPTDEQLADA